MKRLILAGAIALVASTSEASILTLNFTFTGFYDLVGSDPAPTDPVSGTIVYQAAGPTSIVTAINSISLQIDGHTYSVGELGFAAGWEYQQLIGGTLSSVGGVSSTSNDLAVSNLNRNFCRCNCRRKPHGKYESGGMRAGGRLADSPLVAPPGE